MQVGRRSLLYYVRVKMGLEEGNGREGDMT